MVNGEWVRPLWRSTYICIVVLLTDIYWPLTCFSTNRKQYIVSMREWFGTLSIHANPFISVWVWTLYTILCECESYLHFCLSVKVIFLSVWVWKLFSFLCECESYLWHKCSMRPKQRSKAPWGRLGLGLSRNELMDLGKLALSWLLTTRFCVVKPTYMILDQKWSLVPR